MDDPGTKYSHEELRQLYHSKQHELKQQRKKPYSVIDGKSGNLQCHGNDVNSTIQDAWHKLLWLFILNIHIEGNFTIPKQKRNKEVIYRSFV